MNMEVCETESEDPDRASEAAFSLAIKRYAEIVKWKEKNKR